MNFGQALEHLKQGGAVARAGWNGKGIWLELQVPDANSKMTLPYIYFNYPVTPASPTAPADHINARGDEMVATIKQKYAELIDLLEGVRTTTASDEVKRLTSVAITEAQSAQMWAVKAVTWRE